MVAFNNSHAALASSSEIVHASNDLEENEIMTEEMEMFGHRVRVTRNGKGKVTQVLQHVPAFRGNPECWGGGNVGLTAMVTQALENSTGEQK